MNPSENVNTFSLPLQGVRGLIERGGAADRTTIKPYDTHDFENTEQIVCRGLGPLYKDLS